MKKAIVATACMVLLTGALALPAFAEEMGKRGHDKEMEGGAKGKAPWSMSREMYPGCMVEMEKLGLSPEAGIALEEKHFKMHLDGIRGMAEIKVLKLEMARILANRGFDVTAAQKKMDEIAAKKREMGMAHLEFLHALAGKLGDKEWENFQEKMMKMHSSMGETMQGMSEMHGMSEMQGRPEMRGMGHGRDCSCKDCMMGERDGKDDSKSKCECGKKSPGGKDCPIHGK